jgi:hypothetical protein
MPRPCSVFLVAGWFAVLNGCERIRRARGISTDSVKIEIPGLTTAIEPACDTAGQPAEEPATVLAMREYEGRARQVLLPPARRWDARPGRFVVREPRIDRQDAAWYWSAGDSSSQVITGSVGPYLFVASRFDRRAGPSPTMEFAVIEVGKGPVDLFRPAEARRVAEALRAAAGTGPVPSDSTPRSDAVLRLRYAGGLLELRHHLVEDVFQAELRAAVLPAALRPFASLPGSVRSYWDETGEPDGPHGWSRVDAPANMRWRLLRDFQLATVRGTEELAAGESDYLVWIATDEGRYRTTLIRGAGTQHRVIGGHDGVWVGSPDGRIWQLDHANFLVPARKRCEAAAPPGVAP